MQVNTLHVRMWPCIFDTSWHILIWSSLFPTWTTVSPVSHFHISLCAWPASCQAQVSTLTSNLWTIFTISATQHHWQWGPAWCHRFCSLKSKEGDPEQSNLKSTKCQGFDRHTSVVPSENGFHDRIWKLFLFLAVASKPSTPCRQAGRVTRQHNADQQIRGTSLGLKKPLHLRNCIALRRWHLCARSCSSD